MFLSKSKIVVDAFVANSSICELFPISKAKAHLPDWWKALPEQFEDTNKFGLTTPHPTLKRCEGFLEYYKQGFIIPLWSDLVIKTDPYGNWSYQYSANNEECIFPITPHNSKEYGDRFNDNIHLKINSPWVMKEKTGVKFSWFQPVWNQVEHFNKFVTLPGVVDYKDQCSTNINLFVPKVENVLRLSAGTPMVHLIPLSDKEVDVRCHVVSEEEFKKINGQFSYSFSFLGKFRKRKNIVKEKSCPFK